MTRAYDPFSSALDTLRANLRDGVPPPGSPLIVADLAKALRVSPTPVREALSRLCGEALVEEHRGRGFSAPRLDPADLGSLYELHAVYVTNALTRPRAFEGPALRLDLGDGNVVEPPRKPGHRQRDFAEALWRGVVATTDNRALERQHRQLSHQLSVPRLVETAMFPDLDDELSHLVDLAAAKNVAGLQNAAEEYHRRRLEASSRIAHAIRDTFRV